MTADILSGRAAPSLSEGARYLRDGAWYRHPINSTHVHYFSHCSQSTAKWAHDKF